jgi:23S rRNA (adenine2503-C2)-methyltransferase
LSKNIKDFTIDELKEEFNKINEKPYRAEQVYEWIYKKKVNSFDEMTNLSKDLRDKLKSNFNFGMFNIVKKLESKDGTKKYLFDINDSKGSLIESVLMEYHHGYTVCVSSEIGCPMGCKFCASTGIKFDRGLTPGEIVEQIMAIERDLNITVSNIVFMGIGEPFDNYDNVMKSIKILNDPKSLNIGARHISISTSGIVPRIYQMADEKMQCTLSISLHSANNKKRSEMMPVNNAYPIEELIKACKYYISKTNKRISFEYALAKDNNDNLEDAKELVTLLHGMLAHVNLIPINKIEDGKYTKSTNENIIKFRDYLNNKGITATIRRELGSDISAACRPVKKTKFKRLKRFFTKKNKSYEVKIENFSRFRCRKSPRNEPRLLLCK